MHRPTVLLRSTLLATLAIVAACHDSVGPESGSDALYTVTDLSPILGDSLKPVTMNGAGQILLVGITNVRVYLWDSGTLRHLPCDGTSSYDLNDRGQVLCGTNVWEAGSLTPLNLPDPVAIPYALSDSGVVGGIENGCAASSIGVCVFGYWRGQFKLAPVNMCCAFPVIVKGIADATGDILYGYYDGIDEREFLLHPSTGAVTPAPTGATRINAFGQMAGTASPSPGGPTVFPVFAWYFNGDSTVTLGTYATVNWLNDRGDVIGWMDSQPVLWRGGKRFSILRPAPYTTWTVKSALMIDNAGRILATATRDAADRTVLLTPGYTVPATPLWP